MGSEFSFLYRMKKYGQILLRITLFDAVQIMRYSLREKKPVPLGLGRPAEAVQNFSVPLCTACTACTA
jgi:hypothetical protein